MATHSSVLAWRITGTGEPGGLPSMGSHRVRHDWSYLAAAAACLLWRKVYLDLPPFIYLFFWLGCFVFYIELAATWVEPGIVEVSEVRGRQILYDVAYGWNLKRKWYKWTYFQNKWRHRCRKQTYGYQGEGRNWETGINIHTLWKCISCSVMSDSLWPHGLQPTRLLCPWDSPGIPGVDCLENTGVGCHALLQGVFPTQG